MRQADQRALTAVFVRDKKLATWFVEPNRNVGRLGYHNPCGRPDGQNYRITPDSHERLVRGVAQTEVVGSAVLLELPVVSGTRVIHVERLIGQVDRIEDEL